MVSGLHSVVVPVVAAQPQSEGSRRMLSADVVVVQPQSEMGEVCQSAVGRGRGIQIQSVAAVG